MTEKHRLMVAVLDRTAQSHEIVSATQLMRGVVGVARAEDDGVFEADVPRGMHEPLWEAFRRLELRFVEDEITPAQESAKRVTIERSKGVTAVLMWKDAQDGNGVSAGVTALDFAETCDYVRELERALEVRGVEIKRPTIGMCEAPS